jgi:tetratricopeptide (TPR) repeat protein
MKTARVIRVWATAIVFALMLGGTAANGPRAQSAATANPQVSETRLLLDKAQAAEAHGRMDLAVQAWQQVLLGEPKNAAALSGLARAARSMGDTKLAESYERQLRGDSAPVPSGPAVVKTTLTQGQTAQLGEAAKLSDQGNYAASLAIYVRVFGAQPPTDWAVPYYETEAAIDGGRPHAVEALRALVAQYPQEDRFQVSLGHVLTYDPATRQEGRSYLAKFPRYPQATQALRQSLLWDAANPAMAPEIRAYLATHNDPQLTAVFHTTQPRANPEVPAANSAVPAPPARVGTSITLATQALGASTDRGSPAPAGSVSVSAGPAAVSSPAPTAGQHVVATLPVTASTARTQAPAVSPSSPEPATTPPVVHGDTRARAAAEVAAYQSLNASRIEEAEVRFKAILAIDPQDEKALAGMGYVRMQQGNFMGAISFLEKAKQIDAQDKGLIAALDTARFWSIMGEGHDALAANDLTTAEQRYKDALALRPGNAEALEGLGGTLLKAQQPSPAIPLFEHAIEVQPESAEGWRGLFMAEFRNDEAALALATYRRMPDAPRAQLMSDPLFLQPLASAYAAVGRPADAQAALEAALRRPFASDQKGLKSDIQVELAGILSSANHLDQASAIYQQVMAADPGNAAAWQGEVRLQHSLGRDADALNTIQSMYPAMYTNAIHAPGFAVTVASVYEALKKLDIAQDLLQKAVTEETNAGEKPSPAIEMQLAGIYAERGNPQLAYPIYQQVLRENPDRADAWAGLLSALHVTGHDKEALQQLALIPAGPRVQLQQNPDYLQTMAAVYAGAGQPQEATKALGQVEHDYAAERSAPPANVEIQKAWLLYNGIDDAGLYAQLMTLGGRTDLTADQRRTIQTIWTNWAARRAEQASAVGNPRRALEVLNAAARAFPDNPAAIKLLAIGYAQAGEPHQAVLIYKSQNMASASSADYQAAVGAALSDGDNKDAEIWVRYALAAFPADPQVLILAARFEQSRGDTDRAIKYYRASLKAMPPGSGSKLPSELGLPAPSAPLSLPSAEQPQDISVLLAPGYTELPPANQPYLPNYKTGPLPPYDGTTQLVPPYMTNPVGKQDGQSTGAANQAQVSPEVESAVHDASVREMAADQAANPAAPSDSASSKAVVANGEVYRPYVAYVAPPPNIVYRGNPTTAVSVQLGNDTRQPERPQADVTDVLPTERYGPSARANEAAASQGRIAAAREERVRRLQAESAEGRSGQSHPPSEETITGMIEPAQYAQAQVPKVPASPQGKLLGAIPDTGAQQYPQPNTPPPLGDTTITHERPVPSPLARKAPIPVHQAVAHSPSPSRTTVANSPAPIRIAPAPAPVAVAPAVIPPAAQPASTPSQLAQGNAPVGPAYPLAAPPTDAELRAHDLPALGGAYNAQVPIPQTPRQQAVDELSSLEGSYSGWAGVTGLVRYRSGTSGLDRLYDFEASAEASAVFGRSLRLTALAQPVFLNSGVLNSSEFNLGDVPYLGTMAANAANQPAQQFSNGVGGELQLAGKYAGLAVGYTPYEFLVRNFTGRFVLNTLGNHISIYGDRQPVKDTQLSYAGLYDPGTTTSFAPGPIWGGVVASTGGVSVQLGEAGANFFLSGEGGILTGHHVLDNDRFKGELGAAFRVKSWSNDGTLTVAAALAGMHYQHDEVGLSYGQGGYFSPSYYYSAAVPVKLEGRAGANFHYLIAGSAGVQRFEQDAAPFYPLDPGLQTSLIASHGAACTPALAATYACGEYPQILTTQFHYTVNSEVSYRFSDHWYAGGLVFANNSNNFNTVSAGFFLRYVFRPQHSQQGYPAGLFQVDGIRALQIP